MKTTFPVQKIEIEGAVPFDFSVAFGLAVAVAVALDFAVAVAAETRLSEQCSVPSTEGGDESADLLPQRMCLSRPGHLSHC